MIILISDQAARAIGKDKLAQFGLHPDGWRWHDDRELDIEHLTAPELDELEKLLTQAGSVKRAPTNVKDIKTYRKTQSGSKARAKDTMQMSILMRRHLADAPGHRVYRKSGERWLGEYVAQITYTKRRVETYQGERHVYPAYITINQAFQKEGVLHGTSVRAEERQCNGQTPGALLASIGLYPETDELRAQYLKEHALFFSLYEKVGTQVHAWGHGDNEASGEREERYWWRTSNTTHFFGSEEEPGKAVVDVFSETKQEGDNRNRRGHQDGVDLHPGWWGAPGTTEVDDDGNEVQRDRFAQRRTVDARDLDDESIAIPEPPSIEVPVHPFLTLFDLKNHVRASIHVSQIKVYTYDDKMIDRLILPKDTKEFISVLVDPQDTYFRDVVRGKSGGAIVALTGAPGTGKTLTAECFAEAEHRPLYSVQCSQLGTEPSSLETNLLKIFARARRWNAVVLLDEADVYIRKRGTSLNQNMIVGVFLRVLEYQEMVLFFTTNRPEDIDDAVLSRCIAKVHYKVPEPELQALIWRTLAEGSGLRIGADAIDEATKAWIDLSGRDIKNLLKLAMRMTKKGQYITFKTLAFVKQFKPTDEIDKG